MCIYFLFPRYYGCGLVIPECLENCWILDLGSGSGRDCYALSQLVGEKGHVTGIDMTEGQVRQLFQGQGGKNSEKHSFRDKVVSLWLFKDNLRRVLNAVLTCAITASWPGNWELWQLGFSLGEQSQRFDLIYEYHDDWMEFDLVLSAIYPERFSYWVKSLFK